MPLAVAGACDALPRDAAPVSPDNAMTAVGQVLDVTLERQPSVDTSSAVNVLETYSGARGETTVLVVVFDSAAATVQLTGGTRSPVGRTMIQAENVVVLIEPADEDASRRVVAALRAVAS